MQRDWDTLHEATVSQCYDRDQGTVIGTRYPTVASSAPGSHCGSGRGWVRPGTHHSEPDCASAWGSGSPEVSWGYGWVLSWVPWSQATVPAKKDWVADVKAGKRIRRRRFGATLWFQGIARYQGTARKKTVLVNWYGTRKGSGKKYVVPGYQGTVPSKEVQVPWKWGRTRARRAGGRWWWQRRKSSIRGTSREASRLKKKFYGKNSRFCITFFHDFFYLFNKMG